MPIPRILTRITNHKEPRYQFYQPGFNDGNGCWLNGSWVTVTKEEFDKNGAAHQAMYADVRDLQRKQNYRDPAVPPEKMNERQKKAWLHHCGSQIFEAKTSTGWDTPVSCSMAGGKIDEASKRWLEKKKWKLIGADAYL